tara:strand:- start:1259 stop:1825 length:567 start_codon:yes stop_codon:yes gene_type:complete
MRLYTALVHHPIQNKNGEMVTTAITNMDISDISRSCRTFGVKKYFLVSPAKAQHAMVQRILGHWESDAGSMYNPDRTDAMRVAMLVDSLEIAAAKVEEFEGVQPRIVVTGAQFKDVDIKVTELAKELQIDKTPVLLVFGTGWGLHTSLVEAADARLEPIFSKAEDGYNHLSVRSAVAIYLDRLTTEVS